MSTTAKSGAYARDRWARTNRLAGMRAVRLTPQARRHFVATTAAGARFVMTGSVAAVDTLTKPH